MLLILNIFRTESKERLPKNYHKAFGNSGTTMPSSVSSQPYTLVPRQRLEEKMKLFYAATVLCLIALPVQRAAAQGDHAPTVARCRADWNLWLYQLTEYNKAETARLKSGTPDHTELHGLTMAQLTERDQEMRACAHVDPSKGDPSQGGDDYTLLGAGYTSAWKDRYVAFVYRHNLNEQLLREDKAGVR
jgi:hypothetical protein